MEEKRSHNMKTPPWERGTQVESIPDPPASGECSECGGLLQINMVNDKVYCRRCEQYKEDMKEEE